ncbi:hybrid sensor histidine kinase/response regulator [Okeania sp.]|uniref:hybrid sensor histidine kinase/response regulator n=1 Tax=Okeania sp. TaxID=3100323 RepID=UPI002B4B7A8F|nr:hybrid sensor histidine kinase/response regulator [Okeania sp.]MEB3341746.1 hybrid sensor histidine kinase/response regulator [Okeania sp.]
MNYTQDQIIIIDDTPANLHVLSSLLKENGYLVRAFPSGKLALAFMEKFSPSLILLDIKMPNMDGYEVCQNLKANKLTADIPVIFISALDEVMDKIKAFTVGGVDYITKPFQAEEVLARISTHLELSHLKKMLKQENYLQAQQLAEQNRQLQRVNQELEKANQELNEKYDELKQAQLTIIQSEKMSALGNLLANIAHDINNPVGFLSGNIQPALDYVNDLFRLLDLVEKESPNLRAIKEEIEEIDLDYIREDFPKLINSMEVGVKQLQDISISLRTFSRTDTKHPVLYNIHDGIDSTITILKYRLKTHQDYPEINIIKNYAHLPPIDCYAGQLNQVFMNILSNAIDAIEEANKEGARKEIVNQIRIETEFSVDKKQVIIHIADNGIGMSQEVKEKVFEQGFTTKVVGKGTGLGMAIARNIVVEKHKGSLTCNSQLGKGTEFIISLPVSKEK